MALRRGDHIKVRRNGGLYSHHGIYIGQNKVVHYAGDSKRMGEAKIDITSLTRFADGEKIKIVEYSNCLNTEDTIRKATLNVHKRGYNLVFNNCEHFATFCKTGTERSSQVSRALSVVVANPLLSIGLTVASKFYKKKNINWKFK